MRRIVSRLAFSVFLLVASASACAADDVPLAADAHRPHRWSMQFQIGDNLRLQNFGGAGLAVTRNAGANDAWRLGLTWSGRFTSDDGFSRLSQNDTLITETPQSGIDQHQAGLGLDLLRLHRFHPGRRAGLELGVGPSASYNRTRTRSQDDGSSAFSEERLRDLFVGVSARLGAEVLVARSVSVHAHYGARVGYEEHQRDAESVTTPPPLSRLDHRRLHGLSFSNQGLLFGLSVYL